MLVDDIPGFEAGTSKSKRLARKHYRPRRRNPAFEQGAFLKSAIKLAPVVLKSEKKDCNLVKLILRKGLSA